MSDTPKFTVVDRRKLRENDDAEPVVEKASPAPTAPVAEEPVAKPIPVPTAAPRLTLVESPVAVADEPEVEDPDETLDEELGRFTDSQAGEFGDEGEAGLPPVPTVEEARFQLATYEKAAERLDDLVLAQNPAVPKPEKIGFEHLVQQLYLSAMMQMGAGTPEGQRPRIDILGARQTIDLLGVLQNTTKGAISDQEERTLRSALFEVRATFLELTRMIANQPPMPPPPGPGFGAKR